ncbi:hypothetical protein [Parapedobacter indicus]|uniref:Uncharacterized protein n=1 Tax=Parapedobacter indicus TaxID=1477437 RepID=A0A1I3HMR1_9SPHI|nr:hypothetical protein [Parapedobacter indicus]PPL03101.1 hypothetical protein CLV26_103427 [Parapedobacter indicus]SFI37036.1 hypothetical protein SAMN05444682_103426 [Parapedobacter indicus]
MPIISITEGQTNTVNPADTLLYPGINSCLALTAVLSDATRRGGHAVLFPQAPQQDLQQICNFLNVQPKGDMLYILGDITTWNTNWDGLPQCQNLVINGQQVDSVEAIADALGYGDNRIVFDIYTWETATYNIYFGFEEEQRKLWAIRTSDGSRHTIPQHEYW